MNSILLRLCSLLGYFLLPCRASLTDQTQVPGPAGNLQETSRKTTLCHGNGFHPMSRSSPHGMESIEMAHWLASMWCSSSTVGWVANWWVHLTLNPCTLHSRFFHLLLPGITPPTVIEPPFSAKHSAKTSFSIGPSWRNRKWLAASVDFVAHRSMEGIENCRSLANALVWGHYGPGHSPPHGFSMLLSSHESCSLRHC